MGKLLETDDFINIKNRTNKTVERVLRHGIYPDTVLIQSRLQSVEPVCVTLCLVEPPPNLRLFLNLIPIPLVFACLSDTQWCTHHRRSARSADVRNITARDMRSKTSKVGVPTASKVRNILCPYFPSPQTGETIYLLPFTPLSVGRFYGGYIDAECQN